jgi:hypothetical protein
MAAMSSVRRHLGDWISVRAHGELTPPRLTLTFEFGSLPDGWARPRVRVRTWTGLVGLVCIAPFVVLLGATLLHGVGISAPYESLSTSSSAILAATLSLFIGIPIAIAINLWRIGRIGMRRTEGALEGLIAIEFAPLHLIVLVTALLVGGLFVGHLAADSYACLNGVHSAC